MVPRISARPVGGLFIALCGGAKSDIAAIFIRWVYKSMRKPEFGEIPFNFLTFRADKVRVAHARIRVLEFALLVTKGNKKNRKKRN